MLLPKLSGSVRHIKVPFEMEEDVGLGEVIKRLTAALGVPSCGGCNHRAAALNERVVFRGRQQP